MLSDDERCLVYLFTECIVRLQLILPLLSKTPAASMPLWLYCLQKDISACSLVTPMLCHIWTQQCIRWLCNEVCVMRWRSLTWHTHTHPERSETVARCVGSALLCCGTYFGSSPSGPLVTARLLKLHRLCRAAGNSRLGSLDRRNL